MEVCQQLDGLSLKKIQKWMTTMGTPIYGNHWKPPYVLFCIPAAAEKVKTDKPSTSSSQSTHISQTSS